MSNSRGSFHFESNGLTNPYDLMFVSKTAGADPSAFIADRIQKKDDILSIFRLLNSARKSLKDVPYLDSDTLDPVFIDFISYDNDIAEYYVSFFTMLFNAGVSLSEITSFAQDLKTLGPKDQKEILETLVDSSLQAFHKSME